MSRLYIPNSVALRNFDSIFKDNDFLFDGSDVNITFHPTYIAMHPVAIAFYAALADHWREKGIDYDGEISYKIKSIPYLQRMGFFRCLGFNDPVPTKEHDETGRFIPLTKITDGEELETFIKTIDPILHTSRKNSRAIKHVFSELIRNVLEHSQSMYGANVCASYNHKRKKISIGISDAGVGLTASLRKHHKITSDEDAILKALTPGITGSTKRIGGNEQNAGAGLFFTKSIAKATRNHFLIYSGTSYFKLLLTEQGKKIEFKPDPNDDKARLMTNLPKFQGTLVGIDIYISDQNAFNNLIENIGKAYQLGVKKTQKDYFKRINFT